MANGREKAEEEAWILNMSTTHKEAWELVYVGKGYLFRERIDEILDILGR